MATPLEVLRAVADPVRLAVLGRSVAGPVDVQALAAELQLDERDVLGATGRLREAGLLDSDLALDREALRGVARELPRVEAASATALAGEWSEEEAAILGRFFVGDRLTEVPSSRAKRVVVLERLAQEFEVGVRYPERQVNFVLQLFHADHAALRRYLVDEGLMTRADGVYWRTGGRMAEAREGAAGGKERSHGA